MVKVGDVIEGMRVTRVYNLCGMTAYEVEPVGEEPREIEQDAENKSRRGRKKA